MGSVRARAVLAAALLFCVAPKPGSAAETAVAVRAVAVASDRDHVRVEITSLNELKVNTFFVAGERGRFILDVPGAVWADDQAPGQALGGGLASGYRVGRAEAGQSRFVLDLSAEARVAEIARAKAGGEWRLSYVLAPAAQARRPVLTAAPIVTVRATRAAEFYDARKIIVIDAGHGGKDPGALSRAGRQEKDIALASALALKANLERMGRYQVVLTRASDKFVPLPERVRIAREARADLFISLHADSNENQGAEGASIYTLSSSGEARAKRLMNANDWELDLGDGPRSSRAEAILVDLTQRESTSRSEQFAGVLAQHLDPVAPLLRNTHRSAGYYVLLAPDVPAVLLELGFMTNDRDERRLSSPQAREQTMSAVARAIDAHFRPVMDRSYAEATVERASAGGSARP